MAEGNRRDSGGRSRKRRSCIFLNEELQQEILLRLPIKCLTRFKCVCKTWQLMLNSGRFIELYGRRSKHSLELHTLPIVHLRKMVPGLADDTPNCPAVVRVWGPLSNGIYCLTSCEESKCRTGFSLLTLKIALLNPATHHYKFTNPIPRRFHALLSTISSKPCKLHFGFGYVDDIQRKDYRVVVLINYNFKYNHEEGGPQPSFLVLVYTYSVLRGRGVWKKIVDYEAGRRSAGWRKAPEAFRIQGTRIWSISYPVLVCPQGFFEGCYHWMANCENDLWHILSFRFADQSFKLLDAPPTYQDSAIDEQLSQGAGVFVLHDCLAAVINFSHVGPTYQTLKVDVWMMMEYGLGESWTRIYTINPNLDVFLSNIYGIHYRTLNSGVGGGGILIERLLFEDKFKQQMVSFDDARHQVLNTLGDYADKVCWNTPGISTYIETLETL